MATTKSKSKRSEPSSQLNKLFEDELKDMYWAEKALTKALPKMIKKATANELVEALENHLAETEEHVNRVEKVFTLLGKDARGKKCEGMEGIVKEADEVIGEAEEGAMRDAAIISAAQKAEHYEIASYGTLCAFAQTMGFGEGATILQSILEEEKQADETLTEVATTAVNFEAASEPEE